MISLAKIPALLVACLLGTACSQDPYEPRARTTYLAIEEVDWDYAPSGRNVIADRDFDEDENVFVGSGPDRIGSRYKKALYRAYTDETFSERAPDASPELGDVGPPIRGVVGDTLRVVVLNRASRAYSVHPHGVFYDKSNEGAVYADGSEDDGDAIQPGQQYVYEWDVPERAGPGPSDPSSLVWIYHSHVHSIQDTNAGLVGPIIITSDAMAREDGTPRDVDKEVVSLFTVDDENASHYLEDNVAEHIPGADAAALSDDEEFGESNLMHAINGYVYGNGPMSSMHVGDHVRWYLMAVGTEVDLHTPHWHGNTVSFAGHTTDVVELMPASMKTVDMVPDSPGIWLYHCHVNDHIAAGMITRYEVLP